MIETAERVSVPLTLLERVQDDRIPRETQIPDLPTAAFFYYKHFVGVEGLLQIKEYTRTLSIEGLSLIEGLPSFTEDDIAHMTPDASWYMSPQDERSIAIHGQQHSLRDGIYAEIIAHKLGLDDRDRKILRAVSLLHDIGRINDKIDPNHGQRSVDRWHELEAEMGDILREHGIELDSKEREIVEILCVYHEKKYEDIPEEVTQDNRTNRLLKLFMVADALDRFRAPGDGTFDKDKNWWPDPEYFSYDHDLQELIIGLIPFARQFTLYSEYYRLSHPELTLLEAFVNICQEPGFGLVNLEPEVVGIGRRDIN